MLLDLIKNAWNYDKYKTNSEAVIIACFYNPQNNPYRLLAFQKWYSRIKHLNHRIIECLIGPNQKSQLPKSQYITQVQTEDLLWHKETLLNMTIKQLPKQFKYIFWIDADVIFTNLNWLTDSVDAMKNGALIVQPFEYCVHLDRNQLRPDFDLDDFRYSASTKDRHPKVWRSFCSNANMSLIGLANDKNYDLHGHVGFAWGARREILEECPLYDRGLIGGADHIIAHAAAGHIHHSCISRGFADNIDEVRNWMTKFNKVIKKYQRFGVNPIGFASGDLFHIWHGDIAKRQYLKRVQDYTPVINSITERDQKGLYKNTAGNKSYIGNYYRHREPVDFDFEDFDAGFYEDMGYMIYDVFNLFGRPYYGDEQEEQQQEVSPDVTLGGLEEPLAEDPTVTILETNDWRGSDSETSEEPQEEPSETAEAPVGEETYIELSENFS